MSKTLISIVMITAVSCIFSTSSQADCFEEPRKVSLSAKDVVLLKSYKCSVGQIAGGAGIRMEFHRLSDPVGGLVVAGGSSNTLKKAIGSPKVLQNDVTRTYADLVKRFGFTDAMQNEGGDHVATISLDPSGTPSLESSTAAQSNEENVIGPRKYRHLQWSGGPPSAVDYPAVNEIAALRKKLIPDNLNYYYSFGDSNCPKGDKDKNFVCANFHNDTVELEVWRPMRAEDVANYVVNAKSYNTQKIRKDRKAAEHHDDSGSETPRDLKLMAHVAGDVWPDDLMILTGGHTTEIEGCVGSVLDGWTFSYLPRQVALDVVLLENVSRQPVVIDALVGDRSANTPLRALGSDSGVSREHNPLDKISETLAPGARILVPARIVFLARPDLQEGFAKYEKSKAEIHDLVGANGFQGNVDAYQRVPRFKDYVYGPALTITGAIVNSTRVDLGTRRSANYIDLTIGGEVGSCPYLLSWDDNDHEWVEHGKVLHEAPAKDREYMEARTFAGLRTRFRIEEREPEIAHLSGARLVAKLDNGELLTLASADGSLGARNRPDLELLWGESVDIGFVLPDYISRERVIESRLEIIGYYERYSHLMAQRESERRSNAQVSRGRLIGQTAGRDMMTKPVCLDPSQPKSVKLLSGAPLDARN